MKGEKAIGREDELASSRQNGCRQIHGRHVSLLRLRRGPFIQSTKTQPPHSLSFVDINTALIPAISGVTVRVLVFPRGSTSVSQTSLAVVVR